MCNCIYDLLMNSIYEEIHKKCLRMQLVCRNKKNKFLSSLKNSVHEKMGLKKKKCKEFPGINVKDPTIKKILLMILVPAGMKIKL